MDRNSILKTVEDYIQCLEGNNFQAFCNRLLLTLYPDDYTPVRAGGKSGDMKNDGYCYISRKFFQAHASRKESITKIKKKFEEDFQGCLEKQRDVKEFIYITNDTLVGEVEKFVDSLRKDHPEVNIITWSPKKLVQQIMPLPNDKIEYIIERKLGGACGFSDQTRKDSYDYGILEEIFKYIFQKVITIRDEGTQPETGKLMELLCKIKINFDKDSRKRVKEMLTNNWEKIRIVEEFASLQSEVDITRIPALRDFIQDKYCSLLGVNNTSAPITRFSIFEELGLNLLREEKKKNSDYISNAKAIVLYFFEFCDIGQTTDSDVDRFRERNLFKEVE